MLAAGRSTRMGRAKGLLDAGGVSFLRRCVESLRGGGCDPVVVVVDASDGAQGAEAADAGATVVEGESGAEQVESIRRGLEALPAAARAAAVLPVDHPLVRPDTVAALLTAWRGSPGAIVRPVHEGVPGHPTVFPRGVWRWLVPGLARGARSVVEDGDRPRLDLPVSDEGIVADIDTPAAYARWIGAR